MSKTEETNSLNGLPPLEDSTQGAAKGKEKVDPPKEGGGKTQPPSGPNPQEVGPSSTNDDETSKLFRTVKSLCVALLIAILDVI